jgi:hypothetical protein
MDSSAAAIRTKALRPPVAARPAEPARFDSDDGFCAAVIELRPGAAVLVPVRDKKPSP